MSKQALKRLVPKYFSWGCEIICWLLLELFFLVLSYHDSFRPLNCFDKRFILMFVFHEQCLALSSQILGQYCYCFCLISESTSQKLKYLSTNVEMDSVVHFSVCCRERKFNKNLIKFHLRENQFFGLKVIQLIRAYVGSA